MGYLREADQESLSKVYMYSGSNSKCSRHAWMNEEIKETINRRREACRAHRKDSRLARAFPEAITKGKVEEHWRLYLDTKRKSQDIVKRKRQKERDEVLEEFRKNGGYGSGYFLGKVKNNRVKGIKSLRDRRGKDINEDEEIAAMARDYFEKNGKQTVEFFREREGKWRLLK